MTEDSIYDVAVIGYGPTGATAANLLGRLGLNVVVIERDPDVYGRARAISTDEEVMRIWQSVGLADRLQRDMLPDRPLAWVDADGVPFVQTTMTPRGCGHPPQQFLYQPAVDHVLREGVARFPNIDVLLEHECLRAVNGDSSVELMLADLRTDTFKRVRASYVIAADGGSSPTRGQLGVGYTGRTYTERWVVIDTKVIREWEGHDRLRFHCNPARGHLQPSRARRRSVARRPGLPGRRRGARHAALDRPRDVGRRARRGQSLLEARGRAARAGARFTARLLSDRTQATRHQGHRACGTQRASHHRAPKVVGVPAESRAAQPDSASRRPRRSAEADLDPRRALPRRVFRGRGARRGGLAIAAALGHRRRRRQIASRRRPQHALGRTAFWCGAGWRRSVGTAASRLAGRHGRRAPGGRHP